MTSRLIRFAVLSAIILPNIAFAQTETSTAVTTPVENKQRLVFEIKNFPTIKIPDVVEDQNTPEAITTVEVAPIVVEKKVEITSTKPKLQLPPKVADTEKVYMHEPEIREYICPKMGQKNCDIFVAILKAENGTHECTRDNRGLNKNGSVDVGLAQINWNPKYNPPYTVEQLRDCKFNLDIALKKYEARGFQPWYAYTKGAYKKFLKPSTVSAAAIQ